MPELNRAWSQYETSLGVQPAAITKPAAADAHQSKLTTAIPKHRFDVLLGLMPNSTPEGKAERARLLSVSAPHASAWLGVTVPGDALSLPNVTFLPVVQLRLGIYTLRRRPNEPCCPRTATICSTPPTTPAAVYHHAIGQCTHRGSAKFRRHHAIVRELAAILDEANWLPTVEPSNLFINASNPAHRGLRPDLIVEDPSSQIRTCLDVCFTSPLRTDYLKKSCKEQLWAATTFANTEKVAKYSAPCREIGSEFVAICGEYYGGFYPPAVKFLTKLAGDWAAVHGKTKAEGTSCIFGRLSIAQQRANGYALNSYGKMDIDLDVVQAFVHYSRTTNS